MPHLRARRTRHRIFSMAHLYRQDLWSEAQNRTHFGACFSAHGHGHNYRLEVTLEGLVDPAAGVVIDDRDFESLLTEAVTTLDHRHANFDVSEFQTRTDGRPTLVPTTENLGLYLVQRLRQELQSQPLSPSLVAVQLFEMPDLWVEWTHDETRAIDVDSAELTHEVTFRAQHRLHDKRLSDLENARRFGPCARPHGHQYRVLVTIDTRLGGEEKTSRPGLATLLEREIYQGYDGCDLNLLLELPTLENLALQMKDRLGPTLTDQFKRLEISDGATGSAQLILRERIPSAERKT